jgi:hypothetical protein
MTWKNGELASAVIHSRLGNPCKLRYGENTTDIAIEKDQRVRLDGNLDVAP